MKKQIKVMILVMVLVIPILIFVNEKPQLTPQSMQGSTTDNKSYDKYLADPTYCERDEDCVVIHDYGDNFCCSHYCVNKAVNVNMQLKVKRIKNASCKNFDYSGCYSIECPLHNTTATCLNNTCQIYQERSMTKNELILLLVDNITDVPIPNLSVSVLVMAEGNWESGYLALDLTTNNNGNVVIESEKVGRLTGKNVRITIFVESPAYHSKRVNQTFSVGTPVVIPLVKVTRCIAEECNQDCKMNIRQAFHCSTIGVCKNDKCRCKVNCTAEEG